MAKVELITRAFNRLEYTVLCVRGVHAMAGMEDYRHIIIDQASTDGTGSWLRSIASEGFYHVKPIFNTANSGDAGGMADGLAAIGSDCKYVMQFDNDCEPITGRFLANLTELMDTQYDIGAVMLKRMGVTRELFPEHMEEIDGLQLGTLPERKNYTCCTLMRRDLVDLLAPVFSGSKIQWVQTLTRRMRRSGYRVYKCMNIRVMHIDGTAGQVARYRSYFKAKTTKGSNFTAIDYANTAIDSGASRPADDEVGD